MQEIKGARIYTGNGHEDFVIGKALNSKTDRHVTTLVDNNKVVPILIKEAMDNKILVVLRIYPLDGPDQNELLTFQYKGNLYRTF